MTSLAYGQPVENPGTSGAPGSILFAGLAGVGGYALGKEHGRREGYTVGYQQAKAEDMALTRQLQLELGRAQAENRQLIGDKSWQLAQNCVECVGASEKSGGSREHSICNGFTGLFSGLQTCH